MVNSPVTRTVVEVLETEDKTWQALCSSLGRVDDAGGLLGKYQAREAVNDIRVLHDALHVEASPLPECAGLRADTSTLDAARACVVALRAAWTNVGADAQQVAEGARELLDIVQKAADDPDTAMRDLTRELNFSLVVLVRLAEVAQVSEQTIDDVTESLGWWSAAVRIPLKLVVAEVLVRLNELVMMEIEDRGWITPSDTARNSCKLLAQGSYRTTVQTRLLRRTVLRFGERSGGAACGPDAVACAIGEASGASGVKALCDQIDDESNDLCRRALRKMHVPRREITETLDPSHLLAARPPAAEAPDKKRQTQVAAVRAAAPVCAQIDASMRCLSDVASIFVYSPTTVWQDRPLDLAEIQAMRVQLSEMRGAVGSMHTEMRRAFHQVHEDERALFGRLDQLEGLVKGPLTRKIEAALRERCEEAIKDRLVARTATVQALLKKLGTAEPLALDCADPAGDPSILSDAAGIRVLLDRKAMCNPFESSYISFLVDGTALFDSCSCTLARGSRGETLAKELTARVGIAAGVKQVQKIEIVGHADPSGIDTPCRQCKNVKENDMLSEHRAGAFAAVVKEGLQSAGPVEIAAWGAGSTQPVDGKRCAVDDEDCYAKNRRIEVRLFMNDDALDPRKCVAGSGKPAGKKP